MFCSCFRLSKNKTKKETIKKNSTKVSHSPKSTGKKLDEWQRIMGLPSKLLCLLLGEKCFCVYENFPHNSFYQTLLKW